MISVAILLILVVLLNTFIFGSKNNASKSENVIDNGRDSSSINHFQYSEPRDMSYKKNTWLNTEEDFGKMEPGLVREQNYSQASKLKKTEYVSKHDFFESNINAENNVHEVRFVVKSTFETDNFGKVKHDC